MPLSQNIQDRIESIEAKLRDADISDATKAELLSLLSALKSEVQELAKTRDEDARSIACFVDASAHEATRTEKKPELLNRALSGLTESVQELEASHPELVNTVNRFATILSNMGI